MAPSPRLPSPAAFQGKGGVFVAAVLGVGALDVAVAFSRLLALLTTAMLSLLALTLLVTSARRRWKQPAPLGRLALANAALIVSFLGARWMVLLRGDPGEDEAHVIYGLVAAAAVLVGYLLERRPVARLLGLAMDHPARLMLLSFSAASVLASLLLLLPASVRDLDRLAALDALFMGVSAVCVTGLATVNVAETYTFFGQLVLCAAMQIGGIGIMALSLAVTELAGKRVAAKARGTVAQMIDAATLLDLRRALRATVVVTLACEAVGAALLYVQFRALPEVAQTADAPGQLAGAGSALWAAIFHSVSAFCNGSLSNLRGGFVPLATNASICQISAALIILGGLGFPVFDELLRRARALAKRAPSARLSLNTRVSLATSALLLLGLAASYLALEGRGALGHLGSADRVSVAFFQSACARTSGFTAVDLAAMPPASLLLTAVAMFIGGSPGSTAGGAKTTTAAVLLATARAELGGRPPRLFSRELAETAVRRAVAVVVVGASMLTAFVFALLLLERQPPLELFFEAVSAFSTTGLSTGITPSLGPGGKLVLMVAMLLGRVGPLTVALAVSTAQTTKVALPKERVMIG